MIRSILKALVPPQIRAIRYHVMDLIRPLYCSPPMREFSDYDDYWKKRGKLKMIFRRWIVGAEMVPQGGTLFDIGSGTGEFLEYVQKVRPDVQMEGSDFSLEAVKMLGDLGLRCRHLNISEQSLDGVFDVVTCFEVLEHLPEAEHAMERIRAAFRHRLVVSIPNVGYIGNRVRLGIFGRFPITVCRLHIKEHVRHWTVRDFKEWLSHFNLKIESIQGQYGAKYVPWRRFPALFARGLIYVIQHDPESPKKIS